MDQKLIEQAGLTSSEARIYLCLLEKGSSKAGDISRHTGLHRRSVYDAIERIIQKGLVSYIKSNNRRYYQATEPRKLLEIIREKEDNLKQVMPDLERLSRQNQTKKEVVFFRGKQAIKTVFDDQIKEGREVLVFGDDMNVNEIVKYYFPRFDKKRKEKNIPVRMIFDIRAKKVKRLKNLPLAKIRYINKPGKAPVSTNIYADKTSMIIWEENPKAILIKEPAIAQSLRSFFEYTWKTARQE